MPAKKFCIQTVFAFILLLMPAIALVPQDSVYTFCDFFGYYSEARMIATGQGRDIYEQERFYQQLKSDFPDYPIKPAPMGEPPLSAPFILPIALVPKALAYRVWQFAILACLSISLVLWSEICRLSERQFLLVSGIASVSGPIWEVIRVAKPMAFVWLGWTLSVWFWQKKKSVLAGVLFAPWTIKPQQMLPFIALMTGARQIQWLLGTAAATVFLFLLSLGIFGTAIYSRWLAALSQSAQHLELTGPYLHPVLRGQLMRILGTDANVVAHVITPVAIVAYALALGFLCYLGHRFRKSARLIQLSAACMPLGIVTSPYCQNYDLVILIASVVAFFKLLPLVPMSKPLRIACLTLVAACLLVFELPFYTFIHYTYLAHGLITINPFFVSLCVLSALFIWSAMKVCASESAEPGLGSAGSGQAG